MKYVIEMKIDNAAFDPEHELGGPVPEIVRILRRLAASMEMTGDPEEGGILDVNGNRVGFSEIQE